MTKFLKKSIIVGVYIEVLVLILWILFQQNWIYRIVKLGASEVLTNYSRMLVGLFGVMLVVNGILIIVVVIAAIISNAITKNNK